MDDFEAAEALEGEETPLSDYEDIEEAKPEQVYLKGFDFEETEQEEVYSLALEDYGTLAVSSIPVGGLTGALFMIIGLAVLGVVKIFKQI